MKPYFQILYCLLFLGVTPHICAYDHGNPNWERVSPEVKKICASVENLFPPPQDLPDAEAKKELEKGCDPLSLYYGLYEDVNYVKARQCALLEHSRGNLVLAMIYANGKGVERNLDLATQYACFEDGAPAENEGRIRHLQQLKLSKNTQKDFGMCDDITSGIMEAECVHIGLELENKRQTKELAALTSKWTPAQQKALRKLQEASGTFFEECARQEVDTAGTAGDARIYYETSKLRTEQIKLLQACDQCKIPSFTPEQFQEADKQLNILYKKAMSTEFPDSSGISPFGIKTTQRAWIKYRDAWVAFGHEKCPNISKESWKTIITNERITQLSSLANM